MTAITLGKYFKVPAERMKRALEDYRPRSNRSQILKQGNNTFLLDAYNANPSSMEKALKNFKKMQADKKIVILGDMLELGEYSKTEHDYIADLAIAQEFSTLILVGKEFKDTAKAKGIHHFDEVQALKKWWYQQKIKGSYILIKGSRGVKLEELIK